jgi:two-component system nitrogen regulation response regulator NtrX
MTPGKIITLADLPVGINQSHQDNQLNEQKSLITDNLPNSYREAKEVFEKQFLAEKLRDNDWNVSKTADEIGLERSNLHRKIKSYQIEPS